MQTKISLFWFRRDLRLEDNTGLYQALNSGHPVLPLFIFDENILNQLEDKKDRRVDYFHQALSHINDQLKSFDSTLRTFYGDPLGIFKMLSEQYTIHAVFCNRDYEPQAIGRDVEIYQFFKTQNIPFKAYKDQVIFDKNEILKNDGTPYTVFTPYSKKWKAQLSDAFLKEHKPDYSRFFRQDFKEIISLRDMGFQKTDMVFEEPQLEVGIIGDYDKFRDYPAEQRTTQLGIAFRFGTISIRHAVGFALAHNPIWLNELIWREFFMQILDHFPKVTQHAFKAKYDRIEWRNEEQEFRRWCQGKTGYPLVDAGMRQLNETGYMHNRVRMIAASFLCKHLLIDWRWGETYFAQKLNDYDLAANNGNWQWAAGSGCDGAPYFRVFNPTLQAEKFDKKETYIRKWISEFDSNRYPKPMVEHRFARNRALEVYRRAFES